MCLSTKRRVPRPPTTRQILLAFWFSGRAWFLHSTSFFNAISLTFSSWHCNFVKSWAIATPFHFLLFFKIFALNNISAFISWHLSLTITGRLLMLLSFPTRKNDTSLGLMLTPRSSKRAFNCCSSCCWPSPCSWWGRLNIMMLFLLCCLCCCSSGNWKGDAVGGICGIRASRFFMRSSKFL